MQGSDPGFLQEQVSPRKWTKLSAEGKGCTLENSYRNQPECKDCPFQLVRIMVTDQSELVSDQTAGTDEGGWLVQLGGATKAKVAHSL